MRRSQIVVYENPGSPAQQLEKLTRERDWTVAQLLEQLTRERGWLLREVRQRPACIHLIRENPSSILVVKLERKLVDEMTLISKVHLLIPNVPIVVVNDVKLESEQRSQLTAMAYDLGASVVLFPPYPQSALEQVVLRFMEATVADA